MKYFADLATAGARAGLDNAEIEQGFDRMEDKEENPWISISEEMTLESKSIMQDYRMHLDMER